MRSLAGRSPSRDPRLRPARPPLPTLLVLPALLVLPTLLAGCAPKDTGGAFEGPPSTIVVPDGTVLVQGISYQPELLVVASGREVVWSFDDGGVPHTVTAEDGSFDSGRQTGGEFRRVFPAAGSFRYHCQVHAKMNGTVTVTG